MNNLKQKIKAKKVTIAIVGLGTIGTILLKTFKQAKFKLIGYDKNPQKIKSFNVKNVCVSSEHSILEKADVIIVCVNTPLKKNGNIELTYLNSAIKTVSKYLKDKLIIISSTSYPGTTKDILKTFEKTNLKVGSDFYLASVPELYDANNKKYPISKIPKMIGGITKKCFELAKALYTPISPYVVHCSDSNISESAKILQNTYRLINISFINEMKMIFDKMGIDIWEVIKAASSKPFGFQPFYPSPGIGGECIPVDPKYLTWIAKKKNISTNFIDLATKIDKKVSLFVVNKISSNIKKNDKILVLGVAYKKDTNNIHESSILDILSSLKKKKYLVSYHDPLIKKISSVDKYPDLKLNSIKFDYEQLKKFDVVVIGVDHSFYNWEKIKKNSQLIIDTRHVVKKAKNVIYA
jgi:UDP-N-acetyl-D-glucosamine dehydrogenase